MTYVTAHLESKKEINKDDLLIRVYEEGALQKSPSTQKQVMMRIYRLNGAMVMLKISEGYIAGTEVGSYESRLNLWTENGWQLVIHYYTKPPHKIRGPLDRTRTVNDLMNDLIKLAEKITNE